MSNWIKLVKNKDKTYDVIIDYNKYDIEFGVDFLSKEKISNSYKNVSEFITKNAKDITIKSIRVDTAGTILVTIPFASFVSAFSKSDDKKYSMAYLYKGSAKEQIQYVKNTNQNLQTVSPSYFNINEDGSLKLNKVSKELVLYMHNNGIKVVPFLSNYWNRQAGINALKDIDSLSTQIAEYVEKYDLDGVNVDIENITEKQKAEYTELVKLLRRNIPSHKEVSVAVAANPNNWQIGWHGSYNYETLAQNSDYLMVMTYDEHYEGGQAGSVSSINFVEKSINYALSKTTSDKVVIGLPFYGRIWSLDDNSVVGKGITNATIQKIIEGYNAKVTFDEESRSPKAEFEIKKENEEINIEGNVLKPGNYLVWYENDESIKEKLSLVRKYDLKGVGLWSLGQEDITIWNGYGEWLNGELAEIISPSDHIIYNVQTGDTIWLIAQRFGTTVEEIKKINELKTDNLDVGQQLKVLFTDFNATYTEYTVQDGDTLWIIAQKYNTSVDEIRKVNNLMNDSLQVGGSIRIPVSNDGQIQEYQPENILYTVQKGDSLGKLSKKYGTTIDSIKLLNSLRNDNIDIGDKLIIPNAIYKVQEGDTLWKISQRFRITVNDIKSLNNKLTDNIEIDEELKMPFNVHIVQAGDTLWLISLKYNSTIDALRTINTLTSDILNIGQKIIIPI